VTVVVTPNGYFEKTQSSVISTPWGFFETPIVPQPTNLVITEAIELGRQLAVDDSAYYRTIPSSGGSNIWNTDVRWGGITNWGTGAGELTRLATGLTTTTQVQSMVRHTLGGQIQGYYNNWNDNAVKTYSWTHGWGDGEYHEVRFISNYNANRVIYSRDDNTSSWVSRYSGGKTTTNPETGTMYTYIRAGAGGGVCRYAYSNSQSATHLSLSKADIDAAPVGSADISDASDDVRSYNGAVVEKYFD